MPIYQYKCGECDHQFEALQKMSDAKLVDCPNCNAAALKKQVTAAAFKLKGSGWYETDFKNSGAKPEAASAKKSSTGDSTAAGSAASKSAASATSNSQSNNSESKTGHSKTSAAGSVS